MIILNHTTKKSAMRSPLNKNTCHNATKSF